MGNCRYFFPRLCSRHTREYGSFVGPIVFSTLVAGYTEAQFSNYRHPFLQTSLHQYPVYLPSGSQSARFFGAWIVKTTSTTTSSTLTTTCTYSTTSVLSCSGRRRRGVLEEQEEQESDSIVPSSVQGYIKMPFDCFCSISLNASAIVLA